MSEATIEELIARSRALIARADALLARYTAPTDCSDVTDAEGTAATVTPKYLETSKSELWQAIKGEKGVGSKRAEPSSFAIVTRDQPDNQTPDGSGGWSSQTLNFATQSLLVADFELSRNLGRLAGADFCEGEPACHICAGCGQPFRSRRSDARCCSPACRQRVSRARRRTEDSQVICDSVRSA